MRILLEVLAVAVAINVVGMWLASVALRAWGCQ